MYQPVLPLTDRPLPEDLVAPADPLVSIIIPVRNGERLIDRTLASAVAQTYPRFEVVVVDDGSTDRTPEVVEAAIRRDNRIRLFQRPSSGLPATRNFAISQSRGEFIAPLDGDDLWHPEKIARQVSRIKKSVEIGLVYCWTIEIDENDFVIPPIRSKTAVEGRVLENVIAGAGIIESGSTPLIRRTCLEAIGGYDASMTLGAEDWKMSLLLAEICEFAVLRQHLVGYRRSSGSMSKNVAAMEKAFQSVSEWISARWPDIPKKVKQQMSYNLNAYLAHQALSNNSLTTALRYQLKGHAASASTVLNPTARRFLLRFAARLLGVQRSRLPRQRQTLFNDFVLRN
jgi:glycosyltransferase involved in cell wall biosynthesis